ncbi:hypothetical protein JTB14_036284 [Gonioctena quinquepunctata]|nr:hypothetical protein JTB14_036284 [Gonioctena quinquepunctata]
MGSLKSKLSEEERRIESICRTDEEGEVRALIVRRKWGKYYKHQRKQTSSHPKEEVKQNHAPKSYQLKLFLSHEYLRCFRCLEMGHIGENCPLSIQKEKSSPTKEEAGPSNSNFAFSAVESFPEVADHRSSYRVNKKTETNIWILDSGSTDHMTSSIDEFQNFVKH